MLKAPAIWFPTISLFIDDDALYVDLLLKNLKLKNAHHIFETKKVIANHKSDFILYDFKNNILDNCNVEFVKKNIDKLIKNENLVSVILSDHHMPDITGMDLLSSMEDNWAIKILFSNFIKAEKSEFFNEAQEKNIDFIIDKTENVFSEVPKLISKSQIKFFTKISNMLFNDLSENHPLTDVKFAKFFIDEIVKFNPDQIVPNESLTRFTFKNFHQKKTKTVVLSDENKIWLQLNSAASETAPQIILDRIADGSYLLCHDDDDEALPDGSEWPLYIRPGTTFISDKSKIFYSIIEH